jgi:hypothetical protein
MRTNDKRQASTVLFITPACLTSWNISQKTDVRAVGTTSVHLPVFGGEVDMKTPIVVMCSAAMWLFGSAAAGAEPRPDQKSPSAAEATFKALDRNHDQSLSKVEAKADQSISAAFSTADINLDGYITKSEYIAYLQRLSESPSTREPPTE